ncbi:unnamed protein product, partial [Effrenium voratum]
AWDTVAFKGASEHSPGSSKQLAFRALQHLQCAPPIPVETTLRVLEVQQAAAVAEGRELTAPEIALPRVLQQASAYLPASASVFLTWAIGKPERPLDANTSTSLCQLPTRCRAMPMSVAAKTSTSQCQLSTRNKAMPMKVAAKTRTSQCHSLTRNSAMPMTVSPRQCRPQTAVLRDDSPTAPPLTHDALDTTEGRWSERPVRSLKDSPQQQKLLTLVTARPGNPEMMQQALMADPLAPGDADTLQRLTDPTSRPNQQYEPIPQGLSDWAPDRAERRRGRAALPERCFGLSLMMKRLGPSTLTGLDQEAPPSSLPNNGGCPPERGRHAFRSDPDEVSDKLD